MNLDSIMILIRQMPLSEIIRYDPIRIRSLNTFTWGYNPI